MQGKHPDSIIRQRPGAPPAHFVRLFTPFACLILVASYYLDYSQIENRTRLLQQQEELHLTHQIQTIHRTFDVMLSDLAILSKHNYFQHIPVAGANTIEQHLQELATEFQQFHIYRPHYDQVRFIDAQGHERICTNYVRGGVEIVLPDQPQDKSRRDYFLATMQLNRKEAYISQMDLNREHGSVEQPPNPVVRLSMPLFDTNGRKFGILVLNYQMRHLFQQLSSNRSDAHGSSMMVMLNAYGQQLASNGDASPASGPMQASQPGQSFSRQNPNLWRTVSNSSSGQRIDANGMYTYSRVRPLDSIKYRLADNIPGNLIYRIMPDDYSWILVSHIPAATLSKLIRSAGSIHI